MKRFTLLVVAAMAVGMSVSGAVPPVRVMLLDGESGGPYHKWRLTSSVLK